MSEHLDCVVIGAGVVGLACARELAQSGREVIVLESANAIGTQTSSRNSEVIHAGIYYPKHSLKAKFCVQGKALLYRYCRDRQLPHKCLGKIIVANSGEQRSQLEAYYQSAHDNGVNDVYWLDRQQLKEWEPAVVGDLALFSPSTGIIDSHALMLSLQGDIERHHGVIAFNSPVSAGSVTKQGIRLMVGYQQPTQIVANTVVNCAGLQATQVASSLTGLAQEAIPTTYYAKGHYFVLTGKPPFSHLVYPIADQAGLGIHVTLDMQGQVRFGPDVQWQDNLDYTFDETRKSAFVDAIRSYYPELKTECLQAGYTGIRPKLAPPGQGPQDFVIQGPHEHKTEGLVNLFGIESPGLTAALAIARYVHQITINI